MILSFTALVLATAIPIASGAPDIIVTSLADSGPGSLRQAIADAPAGGTIRFAVDGDIVLTSGELLIDKSLRVLGGRHQQHISVRVAPNVFDSRVFKVTGGPVKISDLTIKDGSVFLIDEVGAGIYNDGDLQLVRVTIRDNQATFGGGLYNASGAILTIINSTISGNVALDPGICDGGYGGGMWNDGGTVTLFNSTITDNDAQCLGGGVFQTSGTVTFNNTIVAKQAFSSDAARASSHLWAGRASLSRLASTSIVISLAVSTSPATYRGSIPGLARYRITVAGPTPTCPWPEVRRSMPATSAPRPAATSAA